MERTRRAPLRVLLVDSNEPDARAFRDSLAGVLPCEITQCDTAEDGLAVLDGGGEYDLVVTGYRLPGMSGLELCAELKTRGVSLPVVMLTGAGAEQVAVQAMQAGVSDYMIKDDAQGYLDLLPVVLPAVVRRHAEHLAHERAQEQIRQSEARYRRLFEECPVSLWEEDFSDVHARLEELRREGVSDFRAHFAAHPELVPEYARLVKVLDVNGVTVELFGAESKEQLLGQLDRVFTSGSYNAFREEVIALAEGQSVFATECVNRTLAGEELHLALRWSVLTEAQPGDARVLVSLSDITRQVASERRLSAAAEELARSRGELQQLIHAASHDLRAPLRAVGGYAALLRRRYAGRLDSDADDFIDFITEGVATMEAYIGAMLACSRVQTDGRRAEPTDVGSVLADVIAELGPVIEQTGAAITCDRLPTMTVDAGQLAQVFRALLENAMKFARADEPPRIHVAAEQRDKEWVVSITDNGIGIAAEALERVFGMFQRLHAPGDYAGVGAGLTLCRRIVERHGGRVYAESEPGVGSTFHFTIPRRSEPGGW